MQNLKIAVTSAFGVEAVTKRELYRLGVEGKAINGRIEFEGNLELLYTLNYRLRTADRIYLVLGKFEAFSFDELFENLENIPFENYISKNGRILVKSKSVKSDLYAVSSITSISKKAIVSRLLDKFHATTLPESMEEYKIEVAIFENTVTVLLDTSGTPLYKRGYRLLSHEAPLKETLASAIIQLSVWHKEKTLIDCFCGSGTIPIEAAMIGMNIPSGYIRNFAFEEFKFYDESIMKKIREEGEDLIDRDIKLQISGFDIDENAISLSNYHAKQLGIAGKIHFQQQDMRDVKSKSRYGVIISNPPYGERLMTPREVEYLYMDFADMFLTLPDFSAYILTSFEDFKYATHLPVAKDRKLFNGNLECRLYQVLGAKPPKNKPIIE